MRPSLFLLIVAIAATATRAHAQDAWLTVSDPSPTTADRITLDVVFTVAPGWTIEPWAAAARATLEGAGWTVVAVNTRPPMLWSETPQRKSGAIEGALVHGASIVVEPFLAGEYSIPAIEAVATSSALGRRADAGESESAWQVTGRPDPDGDGIVVRGSALMRDLQRAGSGRNLAGYRTAIRPRGIPITLATEPLTVEVVSLLPEDEPDRLPLPPGLFPEDAGHDLEQGDTPLGVLRPAPDEPNPVPLMLIIGAAAALVVGILAVTVAFVAAGEARRPKPIDPARALEELARSPDPDLAAIDRHVRTLAQHAATDRFAPILSRLERIRYSPDAADGAPFASAIAAEAAVLARDAQHDGGAA